MWSVFLLDETLPIPAQAVAAVLQQALGGVVFDHIQRIHQHFGWVARGLDEAAAGELVRRLGESGHAARKKAEATLLGIDRAAPLRKALFLDDGLHVPVDLLGTMESIAWSEGTLVSAGAVATVEKRQVAETKRKLGISGPVLLATGVPVPALKKQKTVRTEEVAGEELVIHLFLARQGRAFAIRSTEFDYGYLGERRAATARQNFALAVADLCRLAPSAHIPEATRAYLATGKLAPVFRGERELFFFNRWVAEAASA